MKSGSDPATAFPFLLPHVRRELHGGAQRGSWAVAELRSPPSPMGELLGPRTCQVFLARLGFCGRLTCGMPDRFCRGGGAVREMRGIVNAEVRKSGEVGHREDFALLRIDPELVDIDAVVLVPVFPSTDMDPGH